MISAKEAAERTGMSKAGIVKALRTGKISGTKNLNGEWEIDPVELFRVYPPLPTSEHSAADVGSDPARTPEDSLQTKVEMLERMVRTNEETIADLRGRLDAEADERRKLMLILTDKQYSAPAPAPKSWWERLLGKQG